MIKTDEIIPKHKQFVQEYLIDFNGRRAAIRAGYAEANAEVQASRLLRKANIKQLVDEAQEKRAAKTDISIEWVLEQAKALYHDAIEAKDRPNALKALEMVGKHTNIQAWKEKSDTQVTIMNAFAVPAKSTSAEEWMSDIT